MAVSGPEAWQRDCLAQLAARDRRERDPFRDLVRSHGATVERERQLQQRCASFEKELHQLRASVVEQQALLRQASASGGVASAAKLKEVEEQARKQQEELNGLYKEKAATASELYQRTTEAQAARDALLKRQRELEEERAAKAGALAEVARLQAVVKERDGTVALLTAENGTLRAAAEAAEAARAKAEADVAALTQRLIEMKQSEYNEMYEELLREKKELELVREAERSVPAPPAELLVGGAFGRDAADAPSKPKLKITAHSAEVNCVAFDERGTTVATGSEDKLIKAWSATTGAHSASYTGAVQAVMSVAFSSDGKLLAGASNDNNVRVWDCATQRVRHVFTGHQGKVFSVRVAQAQASQRVVSGSHDRSVKIWDLARGFCVKTILCGSSVNDLAVNADASMVVSGHLDGHLRFFEGGSGALVQDCSNLHSAQITSVQLLTDGNRVLTAGRDNVLKIVDVRTYEELASFKDDQFRSGLNWTRAAASMDGQWVAAGGQDGVVCLWNAHTGKLKAALKGHHTGPVAGCAWSAEGRLATVARDKLLILWE
eukprot:tig00021127_g18716.t1